ncbi:hypothetical protein [Trichocoleus sp. FACHB-591]|uniref:hypothetical protein n=1 Tax=Trichocoleus sp. FACHB-591 TaxID=2692872 RepID=UPI00351C9245
MSEHIRDRETKATLVQTLWNAIALNAEFYENALNTSRNRSIARAIVILAALSHMLGSAVILITNRASLPILGIALLIDGLAVVAGYYFWTATIWQLGQWLRSSQPTYGELLIPIGFAYAPQAFNFLTLIPLLGSPIEFALALWSLLTVILAVRQGLDISLRWAGLICLVGWPLVQIALRSVQTFEQFLVQVTQ